MPKGLKRIDGFGHLRFITFSCCHRLPLLSAARWRSVFVEVLREVRDRYRFKLTACPEEWIWSSYSFYQETGEVLIQIDRVD